MGYIGTTNFTTKSWFRLVFIGPWTDMDRSYAVQLRSINIRIGPGPVAVAVTPSRCQKPDIKTLHKTTYLQEITIKIFQAHGRMP
jgi:hypothetical protein